jgi:predicted DNA-binding protein with PD1-like motif
MRFFAAAVCHPIAMGGHLVKGLVRPVLEVSFIESGVTLRRVTDQRTGLAMLEW